MKIGIDIRNIGKGRTGDEVVFFNLVKNLSKIDSKNEYLLLTDRGIKSDSILRKELKKMGLKENFKVISLGKTGINKLVWNFWTLPKYLRKNPLDVYQTQYIVPFFVPKKTKIVTIIHDVSFKVFPHLITLLDRLLLGIFIPLSLRRADKIIGVSRFSAEEIKRFYSRSKKKVAWIHNAIGEEFKKTNFSKEDLEKTKKNYDLPEKFILYLGTLQPRKNLPVLIESFSEIKKSFPEMKLVLTGGKGHNFDKKIPETIKKEGLQGEVLFPGFVKNEDKAKIFSLAQVFCFPSVYEGFGIPILEAFACNVPVVASRIPPHMEIAGNAALLFNPKKKKELTASLEKVIKNEEERKKLVESAKSQLENFSWEKTAREYLETYKNLN